MPSKILLTGRPGVGKTTVIRKVVAGGVPAAGGFLTEEIREGGRRMGFRVRDIHSGREAVLSHVDRGGRPRVGKYGVDVAAFNRVGVAALREAVGRPGCVIIDEIGKMELCSGAFREAVTAAMDADQAVLGTIAIHRRPFLDALRARADVTVMEVTPANRDELPARLIELLG
jgi:nucleoside-triphosphatase